MRSDVPYQVNCLHEIFFDAAIENAKELDAYYAEHKAPKGPLHGLPISLKDQFHVKGVETTMVGSCCILNSCESAHWLGLRWLDGHLSRQNRHRPREGL